MIGVILWVVLGTAHAQPLAVAGDASVKVTLTDEPCALREVVNLPQRATWTEGGRMIEGCWAPSKTESTAGPMRDAVSSSAFCRLAVKSADSALGHCAT